MNRYFEKGQILSFPDCKESFTVLDIVGYGSSCVVYLTEASNGTQHILKEYNPCYLDVLRRFDGSLYVDSEDDEERFTIGLERFRAGYSKQIKIRKIHTLTNSTSNIQGIYSAYGTEYIDMTLFEGKTLDKIQHKNFYDFIRCLSSITSVVGNYHDNGFLHLDIKPENVFTIPETPEIVMLFDYDSVIEKKDISKSINLSYTKSWAAPEQLVSGREQVICEATDIYAIGEILFYQIYGRHSYPEERRLFSDFTFDGTNSLLEGIEKPAMDLIVEILKHTVVNVVSKRYQSCSDLLFKLKELENVINPDRPRIIDTIPSPEQFFVGRKKELCEIDAKLKQSKKLFVAGIGGIGKTELVKNYVVNNKNDYNHIIYAVCSDSIIQAFTDDNMVHINNFVRQPDETIEDYYARKLRKLKELIVEDDLIIFDNISYDNAELNDLMSISCNIIFTTRIHSEEYGFETLCMDTINERKDLLSIFYKYYTKPLSEDEKKTVNEICDYVNGHTMAVELIARQMMKSRIPPSKMLSILRENGIEESGKEKIISDKDNVFNSNNAYNHIRTLFNLSKLTDEEIYVLICLALMPRQGVLAERFAKYCSLEDFETINELAISGWISVDSETDIISIHPLIADLALEKLNNISVIIKPLLDYCIGYLNNEFNKASAQDKQVVVTPLSSIANVLVKKKINDELSSDFLDETANKLYKFGFADKCKIWFYQAFEIRKTILDNKSKKLADSYQHLATAYKREGKFKESEEYYFKALEIRKAIYGDMYSDTATSYSNLGSLYRKQGKLDEAEKYYLKALEIRKSIYGDNSIILNDSYQNLGVLYREINKIEKAKQYITNALELNLIAFGENSKQVAFEYSALGLVSFKEGKIEEAEHYYTKALNIRKQIYSDFNSGIAKVLFRLGELKYSQGQFAEALDYLTQAYNHYSAIYGERNINTIESKEMIDKINMEKK